PRSAAGIVDRAPPWHFDVAVVYLAPHLSLPRVNSVINAIWAWLPADSFEVEADRWITTAERRRRNGPSAKLRYQPIDCNSWFGPSRLSFSVLFSVLPRAPSNRPGLQNPGLMWTPPGLSGRPGSRQGRPWWGWD